MTQEVSIHATPAGGDFPPALGGYNVTVFLSTPPPRVATTRQPAGFRSPLGFYPRHPRGWRPACQPPDAQRQRVSIHATLAGGDCRCQPLAVPPRRFLSTPPSRVATAQPCPRRASLNVSIHATLAGGDAAPPRKAPLSTSFYPRHPRGWRRPRNQAWQRQLTEFLSTPPSRVATSACLMSRGAPLSFYPRHPRGWRHGPYRPRR